MGLHLVSKAVARPAMLVAVGLLITTTVQSQSISHVFAEASGDPIPIGVIFAQTGDVSALGVSARVGAVAAVDYYNAEGGVDGRPLEVHFCDDGGDVTGAVNCARELIEQDVVAIVGPITSPLSLAAAPLTEAAEIPEFGLGSASDLTDPVKPYLFRGSSGNREEMTSLADWLEQEGISRVAMITDNGASGQDQAALLQEILPERDLEIVGAESYQLTDTDMTAQLTTLAATDAEVLLAPGSVQPVAIVTKNYDVLGMTIPIVSGAGISSDSFKELAGESAEGMIALGWKVSVYDDLDATDPLYDAITTYSSGLPDGETPDAFSGLAWDMVHILVDAMSTLDDPTDSVAVRDAIEATDGLVGATAVWGYSPENHRGNDNSGFVMSVLEDGNWVPLTD